jgi:hypothetical protein
MHTRITTALVRTIKAAESALGSIATPAETRANTPHNFCLCDFSNVKKEYKNAQYVELPAIDHELGLVDVTRNRPNGTRQTRRATLRPRRRFLGSNKFAEVTKKRKMNRFINRILMTESVTFSVTNLLAAQ